MRRLPSTVVWSLALGGCVGGRAPVDAEPPPGRAESPGWHCDVRVEPDEPLDARLADAREGATVCLSPGDHRGPVRIDRPVRLVGPREAIVHTGGVGTTIEVRAANVTLEGFTVDGSGVRYDTEDAAVAVRESDGVRVSGLRIVRAVFGIIVHQSRDVELRGNEVHGLEHVALGMRGDGIRLWETRASRVEGNLLVGCRDLVVWYSPGNRFAGNRVEGGRYGTHFMYSHDNDAVDNVYVGNVVGVFVMYSRGIALRRNHFLGASGAGGIGLGAKEAGRLLVEHNRFVRNTTGLFLDTTPLDPADADLIHRNEIRLSDVGVLFHGRSKGNAFTDNAFRDNRVHVTVEGRGDARDATWRGNWFDDYAGYDLDGDDVGDVPYVLSRLSDTLLGRKPSLAFHQGTPALAVVDTLGRLVPLFAPDTMLEDPAPRMQPPTIGEARR